ncbi:MAPEG family protein [Pelagerythrobacter sp.]|uniref:MAPEG family protein n=1 Tax=Pelagerythrobacter sp. TaxID=2800702 RepID=UPI0035B12608
MQAQILAPAAVLVAWTLVMLVWMAAVRGPAMRKMGGLGNAPPGGRGQNLEGVIDDRVNWKSHNYTHLLEQPVLFYAVIAILAIMGPAAWAIPVAWAYVAIRVVHSIWQATVNRVPVRFALFALSTLCLMALTIHALALTVFANPGIAPS